VEDEPTVDLVRAQLRRLRLKADLNQEEFGRKIHYSASMVSAIELGQRPLDRLSLARADEVLETGGLLVSLLDLAKRLGEPVWFRPWLEAERNADQLRCFQPTLIPGLLQTENYARAVLRFDDTRSEHEVEQQVAARLARQSILTGENPPQFIAVLDEAALRRTDAIMAEQLAHLLKMAELSHIHIHLIPLGTGLHVGLSGPFALARSADGGWVGHLENQLGGVVVDREDGLATLLARWESVRNEALPSRQSIKLIKEVQEKPSRGEQAGGHRGGHRGGPVGHAQLGERTQQVGLHGRLGDVQSAADLDVGQTGADQSEDLDLAR
jgi:transcriptional regulator with XRE-family HTH domain